MKQYYLDSNKLLKNLLDEIYDKKIIAIDTEFTRQKTYYPILSLIQISVGGKNYAVDCLSEIDLELIFKVISDEKICKIICSCRQDLEIFYHYSKQKPKNIVDVQLMANFCGIGYNVGYSKLVEIFKNIEIDKKLQRSNWQKRPLSDEQIKYAILDVVYLQEIYEKMLKQIDEKGKKDWFFEDMQGLIDATSSSNGGSLFKNFVKNKRSLRGDYKKLEKIKNILLWREKLAQDKDVPRQHLVSDHLIENILNNDFSGLKISENEVKNLKNLLKSEKNDNFIVDFDIGNYIMDKSQKQKYFDARKLIAKVAKENEVKEQFLINADCLKAIIIGKNNVQNSVFGWRYDLFGEELEKIIK